MTQRIAAIRDAAGRPPRPAVRLPDVRRPAVDLASGVGPAPTRSMRRASPPAGIPSGISPSAGSFGKFAYPDPAEKARSGWRVSARRARWGPAGIGLAFLPGARSFAGTVDVRFEDARQFDVEAFGPQARAILRRAFAGRSARRQPRRPDVELRTADRLARASSPGKMAAQQSVAQVAALDLHSYLYSGGTGDDLHKAVFSLAPLPGTRPFRFSLDSAARLTSVAVNGRVVRVQHHGDAVTVPSLPSERWNRVEIVYKTSSVGHRFREVSARRGPPRRRRRNLPVPLVGSLCRREFSPAATRSERG